MQVGLRAIINEYNMDYIIRLLLSEDTDSYERNETRHD